MDETEPFLSICGFGLRGTPKREILASRELKRVRDSEDRAGEEGRLNGSGARCIVHQSLT